MSENQRIKQLLEDRGMPGEKGNVLHKLEEDRGLGHSGSRGDRIAALERDMGIPVGGWKPRDLPGGGR